MNPQKCSLGAPFREDSALEEPEAGSCLVNLARYVVVFRRIRGGNPISGVLLQLVTYKIHLADEIKNDRTK
jgi:hypothetical protein